MAAHYASASKKAAHAFLCDEMLRLRSGHPARTMLTLPSEDAWCVIAVRRAQGERIGSRQIAEWAPKSPVIESPVLEAWGIERQSEIVRRSTLTERGVLQRFLATDVSTFGSKSPEVMELLSGSRRSLRIGRLDEPDIPQFDLVFLDWTNPYTRRSAEDLHRLITRRAAPGAVVAATSIAGQVEPWPRHASVHRYRNASSDVSLAIWSITPGYLHQPIRHPGDTE